MIDENIFEAAISLTRAVNRTADENLPGELKGIVKLHAGLAVGAALVPIPAADIAAAGANVWTMYIRINKAIDLPFSEHLVKSIATGLATNLASYFGASLIVGTAVKLFPGIGTAAGIAIQGATIYGVTVAAGIVYMKALAVVLNKRTSGDIDVGELKSTIDALIRDRENIKTIVEGAKESYKADKRAAS